MAALADAGLVGVRMLKFGASPCFVRDGVGMRELQLEGWKPGSEDRDPVAEVLYKGPFRQIEDDAGRVYPRGVRVRVPAGVAARLLSADPANPFVVFDALPQTASLCGGTA